MRASTIRARRRTARARRVLVVAPSHETAGIPPTTLSAYETVRLALLAWMQVDPIFFDQHIAPLPVSLPLGMGVLVALWQRVEERGIPLRWAAGGDEPLSLACEDTPLATLHNFHDADAEFIADLAYDVVQMRPAYSGLGVQLATDYDYSGIASPFVLAVWRLFEGTEVGAGVNAEEWIAKADYPAALCRALQLLRPVPRDAMGAAWLARFGESVLAPLPDGVSAADVLLWCVGKTSNPLLNTSDAELSEIWGGEDIEEWTWDRINELSDLAAHAASVRRVLDALSDDLRQPSVVHAWARAARETTAAIRAQPAPSPYLVDILSEDEVPV